MCAELCIAEEGDFVRVRLSGERSMESMKRIWRRMRVASRLPVTKAVLIEDRMRGSLSPIHFVALEAKVRALGWPRAHRIAVADLRTDKAYEDDRLAETVAFNRGWDNVKVFSSVRDAEAWLTASRPPAPL